MIVAVADTHTLLWHMYGDSRISAVAEQVFVNAAESGDRVGVSTISLVELTYLQEKRRIPLEALNRVDNELSEPESVLLELPMTRLIAMSVDRVDRQQVPDLPDRIIAATALIYRVPVLSRDRMIRSSDIETIW